MTIELKNISKKFVQNNKNRTVLKNISLKLKPGKLSVITGISGAGKSTLISIAAGIQKPSSGKVLWDGKDINQFNDDEISFLRNKNVGFVSQEYSLILSLSVLDNVRLPFYLVNDRKNKNHKTNETELQKRAEELINQLGLEKVKHSFPGTLSGGENRRAVIARALINDPKVIIADEPSSNLDSEQGKKIMDIFKSLSEKGKTVLIVTHDEKSASVCNEKFVLEDGVLIKK